MCVWHGNTPSNGVGADVLAKTKLVVTGLKTTRLTVLGALAVEILAGDAKLHQILYVTKRNQAAYSVKNVPRTTVDSFGRRARGGRWGCDTGGGPGGRSLGSMWLSGQVRGPVTSNFSTRCCY